MKHYTAYIDEAGDEGFGKLAAGPTGGQSRWLILGACIVKREDDVKLPSWRDKILARFTNRRSRDLHFRDLKHEQKVVVCQELAQLPIGACLAFSNKATIPGTRWEPIFKKKGYLYNFLLRWQLERITEVVARNSAPEEASVRVVFSRRGGTDYKAIREYLELMRDGNEVQRSIRSINWKVFNIDNIAVENHSKWAGLQVADCMTSAFFSAVEPNAYGNYECSYANILHGNLFWDRNGNVLNCGLTPVPSLSKCGADQAQLAFFRSLAKRSGQAPGP